MEATYAYRGDEVAGAYVARCLDEAGCARTADVAEADVVFTHCYHMGAIEDAYFEADGLIRQAKPGTLLVDLSASTPSLARELSAVATVNDLSFVEAPLAVADPFSPDAWKSPEAMVCYVSGEPEECRAAMPFARILASAVYQAGNYGAAQLAKAMDTALQASRITSAIEADALYHSLNERGYEEGADPLLSIPFGTACSRAQKLIASQDYSSAYTVAMFMSDVVAAMAAADDGDLILPHLEATMHILELVGVIGGADKGVAVLGLLYRDEAEGAAVGLDWSRAESLYGNECDEEGCNGEEEGYGFAEGFGGYSAN